MSTTRHGAGPIASPAARSVAPTATRPARRRVLALLPAIALHRLAPTSLLLAAAHGHAAEDPLPAEIAQALPQARLQGQGLYRHFGFRIYRARLWTQPGFQPGAYVQHPFALELIYARTLDGSAIAERSLAEMQRAAPVQDAQAQDWLTFMRRAFPDVAEGDRLSGIHQPLGTTRFLHNGRPTAALQDADFARRFFGIWLAPHTSAPALRRELLGEDKA